jgi:hypothetical protein
MAQQSAGSTSGPLTPDAGDWQGKTLVVYTGSLGPSMPMILTACRFESLGGRLFLAGTDQSCWRSYVEWTQGVRRWVAWDIVEGFLVFDSLEEYYSRINDPGDEKKPTRRRG